MSFSHDPTNGARIYGPDGQVIWSSARQQAYWTNYVTGSFTIAAMPGPGAAGVISAVTQNIRPVAANATHIMGSFTATQPGGYTLGGVANGGIHQLGGTTLLNVAVFDMYPSSPGAGDIRYTTWVTGSRANVAGAILLTTFVQGGFFKAHVQRYKPTSGDSPVSWSGLGAGAITIAYDGVAYTFDN